MIIGGIFLGNIKECGLSHCKISKMWFAYLKKMKASRRIINVNR